jgi:hypothetical protein
MAAATMEARMMGTMTGPPAFTISNMASLHHHDLLISARILTALVVGGLAMRVRRMALAGEPPMHPDGAHLLDQ